MTEVPSPPRPLEIVTEDEQIAAWLAATWPYGHAVPPFSTAGAPVHISIRLVGAPFWSGVQDGEAARGVANTWHHRVNGCTFWVWEAENDRAPSHDASVVGLSLDGARVTIDACGSPFRSWAALTNAFYEAVALAGIVPFHAAAVHRPATTDDPAQTWMVLGRSGHGKTTTLLRAMRAGWTPVAEDVCWVNPSTLEVVGSDTMIGVRPASQDVLREALPSAAGLPLDSHSDQKVHVPWDALDTPRVPWPVTHVAELLRGAGQPPGVAPSTRLRTAMALHEAAGIPRTDRARTTLGATIGRLAERAQPVTLGLGEIERAFP